MHTMMCAVLYDMPKLLACCEYYIAVRSSGLHSNKVVATETFDPSGAVLRLCCSSEPMFMRSYTHVAEAFCMAFERLADQASRKQPCSCACCQSQRDPKVWQSCSCRIATMPKEGLSSFLPSPKELLKMAAADTLIHTDAAQAEQ